MMNANHSSNAFVLPSLGLDFLSMGNAHPRDHIEAAAANGFDSVGLRLIAPVGLTLAHDMVNDDKILKDTLAAQKNTGIKVLDVEAFTIAQDTEISELKPYFDVAAQLGTKIVQAVVEDSDLNRAKDRFAEMCQLAAGYRMVIALEFMKWRTLKSLAETWAFIRDAGQPNGRICIDCLHLSRCGDGPLDAAALPLGSVAYVQLCDAAAQLPPLEEYVAEARGGRLYPGEGDLWLKELLDVLPDDVPLSVEVPRKEDFGKSAGQCARQAAKAMGRFLAQ